MGAEQVAGLEFSECGLHDRCQQLGTQAGRVRRAPLRSDPFEKGDAIPFQAMLVQAGVSTVDGHVAALDLAGRVGGAVRTDYTPPAGAVAARGQVPGVGQPRQHIVAAVVVQFDAVHRCGVGLGGRDT